MPQLVNYNASYYKSRENSPTFRAEVQAIIDIILPKGNDIILEVGCGGGAILARLSQYKCGLLIGLDWLETSIYIAAKRSTDITIISGDALRLPFSDGSFSHLIAQHIIEHFEDTVQVLQEWKRVLRPNGKLVLVTPNRLFPNHKWFNDPSHCHLFSTNEMVQQVESAGFVVRSVRVVNPFFFHLRFAFFAARHLQFLQCLPYFANHGMSIVLSARKG